LRKAFAVHSYKGGTGKTCVTTSLAASLALRGKNVCLLEYDFRGPSLYTVFEEKNRKYSMNDFLDGLCDLREAVIDYSPAFQTKGKFLVGLADPDPNKIQEMLVKDRGWEKKALQRLMRAKEDLFENQKMDFMILDTSPGFNYSSINAIATSDIVILLTKVDAFDFGGTNRMVPAIYQLLKKKVGLVINQVVPGIEPYIEKLTRTLNIPLLGKIPLYPDESMYLLTKKIMPIHSPEHPVVSDFQKILDETLKL
jgi:septum site-determining protein MinD